MTAVKAADVDAFVARPDPKRPVVLVFGPDSGLVSERANALVKAAVDDVNDPFALARLDGEDLAAEPTRLVEEAQTIPLFGGKRAVWVKAGSRNIAPPSSRCWRYRHSNAASSSRPAICAATRRCVRSLKTRRMPRRCPATPTAKKTARG